MEYGLVRSTTVAFLGALLLGTGGCQESGLSGEDGVAEDRPFAYVVRTFPEMGDTSSVDERPVLDPRAPYAFNPGARLFVRETISLSAAEHDILSGYFGGGGYDVKDLTSSPDGERIAFAAHGPVGNPRHTTWNIYEYDFSSGKIRRFIADDEVANAAHDTNPAYTNDGRIIFSSERQVSRGEFQIADNREYVNDFDEPASLLHIMQPDGSEMVQVTFGAYHDIEPSSMNDGQIVFIRWGREYETLFDCTEENIDDPNFNNHPHGGGHGHGNGNGFPPGLEEPKEWTEEDKCGGSLAGSGDGERVFVRDILNLYRVAPSGGNLHRYFGSINEAVTDASFIHYMDPIPLEDGNLITIMRHIYNPIYGGDVVKINSQNFYAVGKPVDPLTTGVAEESQTPGLVNFYPAQVSPAGWYSAVAPYRDRSGRLLASWGQCLVWDDALTSPCEGSSTNDDLRPPQYGIWSVDPAANTRLPVVKGHENSLYTDVAIGKYNEQARPYQSPQVQLLLDEGFGVFHIRSVYDLDGIDMAAPDGGITTLRDPTQTTPNQRRERFVRVVSKHHIPSELEEAILNHPELNPDDGSRPPVGLRPILGSGGRDLYQVLGYGTVEPDGSAMVAVPQETHFHFEVVNKYNKRVDLIAEPGYRYNYLQRHRFPLLLEGGELRECQGCHDADTDTPHARADVATTPANPGAPNDGLPFPNANPQILAVEHGDTMAETLGFWLGAVPGGSGDVAYDDHWTNPFGAQPVAPSFSYRLADLNTPLPVNDPSCVDAWRSDCRIVINYQEHIQPIWNLCRAEADDRSCTSCHEKADNTPQDKCPGGGGSGGELILSGDPDPWVPQEVASYVQLFETDYYQQNLNGEWVLVTDIDLQCPNGVEGDLSVEPQEGVCITRRLMSARGAIASARFFRLFDDDPDDNAYEVEAVDNSSGNPKNLSFHRGMLTTSELRLIAEWLDTGAHYYNDTDKYQLPPQQ